jgi:hypothetical protein
MEVLNAVRGDTIDNYFNNHVFEKLGSDFSRRWIGIREDPPGTRDKTQWLPHVGNMVIYYVLVFLGAAVSAL